MYKVLNHTPSTWRRCGKRAQRLHQICGRYGGVAGKLVADVNSGVDVVNLFPGKAHKLKLAVKASGQPPSVAAHSNFAED